MFFIRPVRETKLSGCNYIGKRERENKNIEGSRRMSDSKRKNRRLATDNRQKNICMYNGNK